MNASAIKPVHPTSGTQAPKVGSGPPAPGPGNSPPLSATGGPKNQPNSTTGSPVKPAVPANPNTNHSVTAAIPVSLVQDHKSTGNALAQPPMPLQRTPEKNKEVTVGSPVVSKPTSNGVEGSEGTSPSDVTIAPVEADPEQSELLPPVQNHSESAPLPEAQVQQLGVVSTTVAEIPPQLTASTQPSSTKVESTTSPTTGTASTPPFGNVNNVGESGTDTVNTTTDLAAPELVPAVSPVNVPQLPTSTTDVSPTPSSASQSFVLDTPPKLTPVQVDASKPRADVTKPEFKVATPPRNSKRKKETKLAAEVKELIAENNIDRKSKRQRTRTQPYQSELTYMTKFKPHVKSDAHDKLIVFYKNEFLAVRNAESSFYVCQAVQNIYKSSARIRIRWLSQENKDGRLTEVYIPDFYDVTDFDCILTNLDLKKLDKNKYQLPPEERDRTLSILNRALDVEKGVTENPPVTEEHPDGLDLSLYKDEAQLKRNQSKKAGKKGSLPGSESADDSGENNEDGSLDSDLDTKKKKRKAKPKTNKKVGKPKSSSKEKVKTREKDPTKSERTSERDRGRDHGVTTKRRSESLSRSSVAKPPPEKKAKLSSPDKRAKITPPKSTRKSVTVSVAPENPIPTRSTKSRSGLKDTPKSSPLTRTKDRERRDVSVKAKGRKLPAKRGKSVSD